MIQRRIYLFVFFFLVVFGTTFLSAQRGAAPAVPAPADVKPGSINSEDAPYPYPSHNFPLTILGENLRMSYMDVSPIGPANGRTVVLLHGNNFGGFYFGGPAEVLRKEGFRVVIPDQVGYGRSSKPTTIPYNFSQWARNTKLLLDGLKVERAMIVGHSMGGMLAARFATQYPDTTERLVIYNPIGLSDGRFDRPLGDIDASYKSNLNQTYQSIRAGLMRYVAHNPSAWNDVFETYAKVRYSWTLSAEWPRLALVQSLIGQVQYLDPVVHDWARIKSPTLVFGGAEDFLAGTPANFQARMKFVADTIPDGLGKLHLIPGLGHVPHLEAPEKTYPPLVAFLKEGVTSARP
jgi:pimeloyl-ACP methyl ester carboxylesterase